MTKLIGNGLYARTATRTSLLDQYQAKQASCTHPTRDPKGTCYTCGHRDVEWVLRYGTQEQPEVAAFLGHEEAK